MPGNNSAQATSLSLLAPNGIVHVTFAGLLTNDQYAELLAAAQSAGSAQILDDELMALGNRWGLETTVRRKR